MTDHADLIRRLEEAAAFERTHADKWRGDAQRIAAYHDERAALLREAAKALKGGE